MLEPILQNLRDVDGVQGAMVVDSAAAVVAYRAHAIYDLPVLQQVARSVINTADSVQLIQDDWDLMTAHYSEGKLVLRNLRTSGAKPRRYVLAVIADGTLNVAFLGVAIRVAGAKLTAALEATPAAAPASVPAAQGTPSAGIRAVASDPSQPELARTGLAWSGVSSGSTVARASVVATSDVGVADTASSAFLSACSRALAVNVGPMAKLLVKDAVRKVCPGRPFTRSDGPALLAQLVTAIDNPQDREIFQRATRAL